MTDSIQRVSRLFLMLALACSSAPAVAAVDQQQPVIDESVGGLALGGQSDQRIAQVFTVGLDGLLTAIHVPVACTNGAPLILEIRTTNAGLPGESVLRSQTFAGAGLPAFFPQPPNLRPLVLTLPLPVAAGNVLAFVLSSPTMDGCGLSQGPVGDPYPGGDGYYDGTSIDGFPRQWNPLGPPIGDRHDVPFATIVGTEVTVGLDFLPGNPANRINPRRGGAVEAALFSSPTFNAASVDWTTAQLGPGAARALGAGYLADVNLDGLNDLVLSFNARSLGLRCGDTSITLLAATATGLTVRGSDAVVVVGCGRP